MSRLIDKVNEFCGKYPEYRLLQIIVSDRSPAGFAIMTTDYVS